MIGSARIEPLIKLIAHCSAPWIFCFNNLLLMGDSKSFGTIWRDLKETKGQYLKGLYKTRSKKVKHEVWLKKVEEDRTLIGLACVRSMRGLYRQGNKTRLNTQKKKKKNFKGWGFIPLAPSLELAPWCKERDVEALDSGGHTQKGLETKCTRDTWISTVTISPLNGR